MCFAGIPEGRSVVLPLQINLKSDERNMQGAAAGADEMETTASTHPSKSCDCV